MPGYAVFQYDDYYHLVKAQKYRTMCGVLLIGRGRGGKDYRPPARVLPEPPPSFLYSPCPRCTAEFDSLKLKDGTQGAQ